MDFDFRNVASLDLFLSAHGLEKRGSGLWLLVSDGLNITVNLQSFPTVCVIVRDPETDVHGGKAFDFRVDFDRRMFFQALASWTDGGLVQ